jgi:transposase-like protein
VSRTGFRGDLDPRCCPGERRFSAVMSRSRKYPEELLERAVRLALESGRPIAHVAADLGIHSETLRKRVRQRAGTLFVADAEATLPRIARQSKGKLVLVRCRVSRIPRRCRRLTGSVRVCWMVAGYQRRARDRSRRAQPPSSTVRSTPLRSRVRRRWRQETRPCDYSTAGVGDRLLRQLPLSDQFGHVSNAQADAL